MAEKKNLAAIVKGNKSTKPAAKVIEKPKTPEEERDLKVKETVNSLLQDVNLNPKDKELLDIVPIEVQTPVSDPEMTSGKDWLREQLELLTSENESLRIELDEAKENYNKILNENLKLKERPNINLGETDKNLIRLFNELQDNHLKLQENFVIVPVAFMNRLIMFFPFLREFKKY